MAIYHLTVKVGSRNTGQSARAKVDYIQRNGKYARDKDEVEHARFGNMPEWADRPADYWDAADVYERANGVLFREVEFALPTELNKTQRRELADEFARHLTEAESLPYTLAIHAGKGENPHCHMIISERKNDYIERDAKQWFKRYNAKQPEKGGARKADISSRRKEWLEQVRADWAELANRALECAGHEARIDHRTLETQGIERVPGIHLGPHVLVMEERGIRTDRGDLALSVQAANEKIIDLQKYREELERERDRQVEESQEYRRAGGGDRAFGSSHGDTDRQGPADAGRDRTQEQGAGREVQQPDQYGGRELEGGRGRSTEGSGGLEQGRAADGMAPLPTGRGGRYGYGSSYERIVALASATDHSTFTGSASSGRAPETGPDRSFEIVRGHVVPKAEPDQEQQLKMTVSEALEADIKDTGSEIQAYPARHTAFNIGDLLAIEKLKTSDLPPALVYASGRNLTIIFKHRDTNEADRGHLIAAVDRSLGRPVEPVRPAVPTRGARILESTGATIDLDRLLERDQTRGRGGLEL